MNINTEKRKWWKDDMSCIGSRQQQGYPCNQKTRCQVMSILWKPSRRWSYFSRAAISQAWFVDKPSVLGQTSPVILMQLVEKPCSDIKREGRWSNDMVWPVWKETEVTHLFLNPMSTAALPTVAKTWMQPKCPSVDEWLKKTWYIYNGILLSYTKEENKVIRNYMDGPRDDHTKWNKPESQISYDITYMWTLKKWYRWTYL